MNNKLIAAPLIALALNGHIPSSSAQSTAYIARRISADAAAIPRGHPQGPAECKPAPAANRNTVQVAILLDTSNSMDGMINQARTQLWRIVNEIAKARRDGEPVSLQIAVYEYGNTRLRDAMTIRQVLPFTTDLDTVSKELFALTTSGGEEYCGAVIERSLSELKWGSGDNPKIIYVCGNEPFNQGPVDFRRVCKSAVNRDVIVNTIHCGAEDGESRQWAAGASLGGGLFCNIGGDDQYVEIATPYDTALDGLNIRLNSTYIAYGRFGKIGNINQTNADALNRSNSVQGNAQRILSKASSQYGNADWDLVDASREKGFDLSKISRADLPDEFKDKSESDLKTAIETQWSERKKVQDEIIKVSAERDAYRTAELKKQNKGKSGTLLEDAFIVSLKGQCGKKGVVW